MSDDNDSGFELTYANMVTVNGKRSPRGKGLEYKLQRGESGLTGMGWVSSAWAGARLGCADNWVVALARPRPTWSGAGLRWA